MWKRPKTSVFRRLNDHHPVAFTPVNMNCFERLIQEYIKAWIPPDPDQYQFTFKNNRSTVDAISWQFIQLSLIWKMSSVFNSINPDKLVYKLQTLGLRTSLCLWIKGFLINRLLCLKLDVYTSAIFGVSQSCPQVSTLCFLYSPYTHSCTVIQSVNVLDQICRWHNDNGFIIQW